MSPYKIIAIGDNVCDKYLSRGKMYPGGQCVNTCVYAHMNDMEAAYLGKYGDDAVAATVKGTLQNMGIDDSHSRTFDGENGFALVTLQGSDRVFLGSNKGGVARENGFCFTEKDLAYICQFDLIYTNLNSYIEADLPLLAGTKVPIAYDFSTRWTDDYLQQVGTHVQVAIMSCAHLTEAERELEMRKAQAAGIELVLGTVGEAGSYILYQDMELFTGAVLSDQVLDTMGAGDSYFAAFLCSLLQTSERGKSWLESPREKIRRRLLDAMQAGAAFAARTVCMEGAFGYGVPIQGRTEI